MARMIFSTFARALLTVASLLIPALIAMPNGNVPEDTGAKLSAPLTGVFINDGFLCSYPGMLRGIHCIFLSPSAYTVGSTNGGSSVQCSHAASNNEEHGMGTCRSFDNQDITVYCQGNRDAFLTFNLAASMSRVITGADVLFFWGSELQTYGPGKSSTYTTYASDENIFVVCQNDV